MTEAGQAVWSVLTDLVQSDLGPVPSPLWHVALTGQMAHVLLGAVMAFYRFPAVFVRAVFCGWMAKELLGDIPNGGGSWLVVADSVSDLSFCALGFIITKARMENSRHGKF